MSLSYSGIVGYGKMNLPSVESWGTNNNIMKDPPRSIVAPRRDKVGSNSAIIQDVEMARDRIAESILAYPRGVNPMVAVSYNGQGNAGILGGQAALLAHGQQAKLPYRVAMDGAFRPPVLAPVDLLPLSRMPRLVTKVNCAVNKPDYQRKITCGAPKKTYKPMVLNTSCAATCTQKIARPAEVIDRRHENIRKRPQVHNFVINRAQKGNTRNVKGLVEMPIKPVLRMERPQVNPFQRREVAGQGASVNAIGKHIGRLLTGSVMAPKQGPKKGFAAPATVGGCRDSVLYGEIQPAPVIERIVDTDRPAYHRAFGMGAVLAPNNGVYNTARR